MLTTRVHPDRRAVPSSAASTSSRHPAAAKQLIGVVPADATRSTGRSPSGRTSTSTVASSACRRRSPAARPTGCSSSSASTSGPKAPVLALSGGMAQRLMVARAIMHRPVDPLPRRAHRRPRPAEPHRAVGDPRGAPRRRPDHPPHHALHGGGRPALRPPGDHRPRPAARPRHARGAEALDRRRHRSSPSPPTGPTSTGLADRARGGVDGRHQHGGHRRRPSASACAGPRACCPQCSPRPTRPASPSSTSRVEEPTLETVFIDLTGKDLRE